MANDVDLIRVKAETVLREAGQLALPIDPTVIAEANGIKVVPKDTGPGVSGMLVRVGDNFTIAYASHIQNDGYQRFSIGHELGHYFIDEHAFHVFGADGIHRSAAGYASRDPHEIEADRFAATLLMPPALFKAAARTVEDGLAGVERLAQVCLTSLTATAIRYAECVADEVFAVVVTKGDDVEFCAMSERTRRLSGITWPKRGDAIPSKTAAWRIAAEPSRVLNGDREDGSVHLHTWFGGGPDLELAEQAVGQGRIGRVLTILTAADAPDDEEVEEEESLVRSWTPTFHRSRRR